MLLLVLGFACLVLSIAMAVWALAAMTRVAGLALAGALLACGAGWFSLIVGWVRPDLVANVALALALLTPAVIMAGRLADRVAVVRVGQPAQVRLITGSPLVAVCVCLNVLVAVGLVLDAMYFGMRYTPPSSDVLPLPATLTVMSDRNLGCHGDFLDGCEREIDVYSAAGLSPRKTALAVVTGLNRLHGWRLDAGLSGCRHEGWLFGREDVCLELQTGGRVVQVLLQSGP
jgi:hypothetical protein